MEHLDAEVRRLLDEQEELARSVMVTHRDVLDALAEALVNQETIKGAKLQQALRGCGPAGSTPAPGRPTATPVAPPAPAASSRSSGSQPRVPRRTHHVLRATGEPGYCRIRQRLRGLK